MDMTSPGSRSLLVLGVGTACEKLLTIKGEAGMVLIGRSYRYPFVPYPSLSVQIQHDLKGVRLYDGPCYWAPSMT